MSRLSMPAAVGVPFLLAITLFLTFTGTASAAGGRAVGDTLTVVMRPILSVPEIVLAGDSFTIEAAASPSATGWAAQLTRGGAMHPLTVDSASYLTEHERWFLTVTVPAGVPEEMYDLELTAASIYDEVAHAVMVKQSIENDFYFIQITDTHLPAHKYWYESGADTDTTEMEDLHAVIDDINIINPAFVVLTGDVINEGELEDFLDKRYYTRTHRILQKLDVPVYLAAGNHDIGGWDDTPPSDGTARRNWWKFFGWRYLYDPPSGDGLYTQNYSFDYGGAHFIALEAYNNYDRWRRTIYGNDSFTDAQLDWLVADIETVSPASPIVLFYHKDFQNQLNLGSLGVDGSLWGHIHYTSGNIAAHPFDLATETVCDGQRAMRLVRVSGGTVSPTEPIDAGSTSTLRLQFDVANDGTETEITASATNNHAQTFEHGLVRFHVPSASMPYEVDNGTMTQTIVDGDVATCYVEVTMPSYSTTYVTISPETGSGIDSEPAVLALMAPALPNPARTEATIGFAMPARQQVRFDIFDVTGRRVATPWEGRLPAGPNELTWDLRDHDGAGAASGIYFYRISTPSESVAGKLVVLR